VSSEDGWEGMMKKVLTFGGKGKGLPLEIRIDFATLLTT
jgi:hypothetical protein